MSPAPRHTEELAVESLYGTGEADPGLLNRLLTLTSGEPTTEELEEALILTERQVLPTLRAWISSRHIINGRKVMTGPKASEFAAALNHRDKPTREFLEKCPGFLEAVAPEQIDTPVEGAVMDEAEAKMLAERFASAKNLEDAFAVGDKIKLTRDGAVYAWDSYLKAGSEGVIKKGLSGFRFLVTFQGLIGPVDLWTDADAIELVQQQAAFDELEAQAIERAHPTAGGLHSIFEDITAPMRRPA